MDLTCLPGYRGVAAQFSHVCHVSMASRRNSGSGSTIADVQAASQHAAEKAPH
jgi:hypothetical protein